MGAVVGTRTDLRISQVGFCPFFKVVNVNIIAQHKISITIQVAKRFAKTEHLSSRSNPPSRVPSTQPLKRVSHNGR